ncbi:MAG: DUF3168 domain-containing protein [Armatimonadota bacterium]
MANEVQAADRALYEALTGDAAVSGLVGARVYASVAPQGAQVPYILFHRQGGLDRVNVGADRVTVSRPVYQVRAVTQSDGYAAADEIADVLDAALMGMQRSVTIRGQLYRVTATYRQEPVRLADVSNGVQWRSVGGIYRVVVQRLP